MIWILRREIVFLALRVALLVPGRNAKFGAYAILTHRYEIECKVVASPVSMETSSPHRNGIPTAMRQAARFGSLTAMVCAKRGEAVALLGAGSCGIFFAF